MTTSTRNRSLARLNIRRVLATTCGCCLPCMRPSPVFYLDVRVRDAFAGAVPVRRARVRATNAGVTVNGRTDSVGDVILRVPNGGPWTVEVDKDWFVPEPAVQAGVMVANNTIQVVNINLEELRYYLHVDGDRNGVIDAQHEGAPAIDQVPAWAWGAPPARGAIILFNNDDDDHNPGGANGPNFGAEDSTDQLVNPHHDVDELGPLRIHRQGPATAPSAPTNWQARLVIMANHDRIRIFQAAAAGGAVAAADAQVAGAGIANGGGAPPGAVDFPLRHAVGMGWTSFPTWDFAMEATSFPEDTAGFDGVLEIRLVVSKTANAGGGTLSYYTGAQVRVAPWMMPHHADTATDVHVAADADNLDFRQELAQVVPNLLVGAGPALAGGAGPAAPDAGSPLALAACTLIQHPSPIDPWTGQSDVWMQDCMEIGNSIYPRAVAHRLQSVMRTQRDLADTGLGPYPLGLLARDFGRHYPTGGAGAETTFDAGGNIEVTPPVRDPTGKEWRWGRIYHGPGEPGELFNAQVGAFLQAQLVQRPFQFDTSWLMVGHVDEVLTFVPVAGGLDPYKAWRLLVASPRRAYEILEGAGAPVGGAAIALNPGVDTLLNGRMEDGTRAAPGVVNLQTTVQAFLAHGPTTIPRPGGGFHGGFALRNFNLATVQPRIDAVLNQVAAAIDIDLATDVIHVPVIFKPENVARTKAGALTADMPNMLVVNGHCLVPRPFGPVDGGAVDHFEEELRNTLGAVIGVGNIHFIEDWYEYHINMGEVHCGTNTARTPIGPPGGGEWWHFAP